MWEKQSQRPSIQRELKGLIAQQVHEEILYCEVLGKALGKGDTVIRRQLASDRLWPFREAHERFFSVCYWEIASAAIYPTACVCNVF